MKCAALRRRNIRHVRSSCRLSAARYCRKTKYNCYNLYFHKILLPMTRYDKETCQVCGRCNRQLSMLHELYARASHPCQLANAKSWAINCSEGGRGDHSSMRLLAKHAWKLWPSLGYSCVMFYRLWEVKGTVTDDAPRLSRPTTVSLSHAP